MAVYVEVPTRPSKRSRPTQNSTATAVSLSSQTITAHLPVTLEHDLSSVCPSFQKIELCTLTYIQRDRVLQRTIDELEELCALYARWGDYFKCEKIRLEHQAKVCDGPMIDEIM